MYDIAYAFLRELNVPEMWKMKRFKISISTIHPVKYLLSFQLFNFDPINLIWSINCDGYEYNNKIP